ncbi:MAG: TetR/AcrR family transcriptional regulator [Deltaproteobacteria bacterium]|nr:TetR/AcrR family transcriptional regulator [Deltaproteobacteria bacterium]
MTKKGRQAAACKCKSSCGASKNTGTSAVFQKRKSNIIKKAAKLFIKKGYAQTSMRDIAKATGIDVGNLYYFIKSKEEILYLIFDMFHKPEEEIFERFEINKIEDPVQQLKTMITELIGFGGNFRQEILLLYRESRVLPKENLKCIMARESHVISQIEGILKEGVPKKVFKIEDTSFTANMIMYELALYSMRHWNMTPYLKNEFIDLLWNHISKVVLSRPD